VTAKVERLVNLTVALLETRRPLTLAEIRRKVAGYEQDDDDSARRMFERDKDDLRRLGVPVETIALDTWENDWGYRVDRAAYELPPLDLSADEVAALAIALQVTGEHDARLGFTKLAARAPDPTPGAAPPAARITVGAEALDALADALLLRHAVRFGYTTATGEASERTVDPYAVVQRRGAWYLVGRDHDRDAVRAFRLERVTTAPQAVGAAAAFDVPDDLDLSAVAAGPVAEGVDVEVAFDPATAWDAARRGGVVTDTRSDGWSVVRFTGADPERLLPWVLSFASRAEVLSPREVRELAIARLRAVRQGATL
jgi:proteasome accessory factor B